jgi:hypothetical protein
MTPERFDVFVVGSADPSPVAQSKLATAVAARHGAPLASVAQAIAEKRLRAGSGLERGPAEALARKLQAPTGLRPLGALSPSPTATPYAEPLPRPAPPPKPAPTPEVDPFAPPPSAPVLAMALGALDGPAAPAASGAAGAEGPEADGMFAPPGGAQVSLELDVATPRPQDRTTPVVARSLPGASGLDHQNLVATSSASNLSVGEEDPGAHSIRCPKHGLLYDKRRAAGCRKCLEGVRSAAKEIEGRLPSKHQLAAIRETPVRRAFVGLGLALFLGFLPAAYHAFRPGADEVRRLRAEQEDLSRRTGTEDNLRRFDEIDTQVEKSRSRAARNTLIIWVAVSGAAFAVWYRVT